MKLRGISLVVPLADLRPLCAPRSRFAFLSPYNAQPGRSHLRGFGCAGRRKLRIPWRSSETVFFDCSGAVSLPKQLPDGGSVTTSVRRVYTDDGPTIHFDLSLFTHPRRQRARSPGEPQTWIKSFWDGPFGFYDFRTRVPLQCPDAFKRLAGKLVRVSGPVGEARNDLVEVLPPLLIVTVEAESNYSALPPIDLLSTPTLYADIEHLHLDRHAKSIAVLFIEHLPGVYPRPWVHESDPLRYARSFPAWLHTDLEVLNSLARFIGKDSLSDADEGIVIQQIETIIESLRKVVVAAGNKGLSLNAFRRLYDPSLGLGVKRLADLGLDKTAERLESAFQQKELRHRKDYDLDRRIEKGLHTFSKSILGLLSEEKRYDDKDFRKSAIRKANDAFSHLPNRGPYVIVSIGGADGSEMFELARLTRSTKGVLLEFDDKAVRAAEHRASRLKFNLIPITGDAVQKLGKAMEEAKRLSDESQGLPILVTIMALLHELPTRSRGFNLSRFFAEVGDAHVLIGREPVEPSNWSQHVFLSGEFDAKKFSRFANDIVIGRQMPTPGGANEQRVDVIAQHKVRGPRGVILETIVKALYAHDLLYELNEWFTWFKLEEIASALGNCFEATHHRPLIWNVPSTSLTRAWDRYRLVAENADLGVPIPLAAPATHLWYKVSRKGFD